MRKTDREPCSIVQQKEIPCYAALKGITLDGNGMRPEELEKTIISLRQQNFTIKFIYLIPDFQNPAGITIPESARMKIIDIAEKYDLLIIEDSPYRK